MALDEKPTYETAWNDLRNRQRLFFLAWIGGFAVVVLLSTVKSFPQWIPLTAWLVAFLYTGAKWSLFSCPRCGKPFFKPNNWLIDQTRQTCPHCELQKYANTDAESEALKTAK